MMYCIENTITKSPVSIILTYYKDLNIGVKFYKLITFDNNDSQKAEMRNTFRPSRIENIARRIYY